MDLRLQLITEYLAGMSSMTDLAAAYGVSRRTAHYWVRLYQEHGVGRLAGASRRPHTSPHATPEDLAGRIVGARRQHPTWGAGKLRAWLVKKDPKQAWPCRDTVHHVLRRAGVIRQRRRREPRILPAHHLTRPTVPNLVWTADFKGEFATGDGVLCYPFTLRDGCSRYVLACTALLSTRTAVTQPQFARAFATYGLPTCIRSDNGPPFGSPALGGLSRLAVWWIRLGIRPERIHPGCPGENGAHEQFHAVLKRETARPPAASRTAQQRRFTQFVTEYNHERPHHAIAEDTPAVRYAPSPRPLPARLPPLEYPAAWPVRRVSTAGQVKWQGRPLFLSSVLAEQEVAFEPLDDGRWLVRLAAVPLAVFHERTWRLQSPTGAPPPQAPLG